jgi:hypothetical protein
MALGFLKVLYFMRNSYNCVVDTIWQYKYYFVKWNLNIVLPYLFYYLSVVLSLQYNIYFLVWSYLAAIFVVQLPL